MAQRRFSKRTAWIAAAIAVLLLVVYLSVNEFHRRSGVEERVRAHIAQAVDEFDAGSVGEVICDFDGGSLGLGKYLTQTIVFAGSDTWQAVLDRLQERGYNPEADERILNGYQYNELGIAGMRAHGPTAEPGLTSQLADDGCVIPADGVVMVQFYIPAA